MKYIVVVLAFLAFLFFGVANAQNEEGLFTVEVAHTGADSGGVLIPAPGGSTTIEIERILLYVDADGTARPAYVTIESQTAARTAKFKVAAICPASTNTWFLFDQLNYKLNGDSTVAPGVRLFVNSPTSDSVSVKLQYRIVPK